MEFVRVKGADLNVSRIGLGTWAIGGSLWGGTDESQAIRTLHAALDLGVTLIDTAPVYGYGVSETIVGKALASCSHRKQAVIATKVGLEWKDGVRRNTTRQRIVVEVEQSLRRLQVDHLDIYQVHWPDCLVPAQETAEALAQLVQDGKVRAIGVSNYNASQMREFAQFAPLHTSQPPYNLFERQIENDVLPYCHAQGITTLMYGPLCRGLLTGRMSLNTTFKDDDIRKVDPKFQANRFGQYLAAVSELQTLAANFGKSVLQLAVRWVLDQPGSDVALWGARHPSQLEPLEGVNGWHLPEDVLVRIDKIVENHVVNPVGPEFMAPPNRNKYE